MKILDIFKNKTSNLNDLKEGNQTVMQVKPGRDTSTSKNFEFFEKFQKRENFKEDIEISEEKPMIMNSINKNRLKEGIIISLDDITKREDLEFIGISRIDGTAIYLYTGYNFSNFNLPYSEVYVSYDEIEEAVKPIDYSDWLARGLSNTEKTIEYFQR
jgi:hypothetical protein